MTFTPEMETTWAALRDELIKEGVRESLAGEMAGISLGYSKGDVIDVDTEEGKQQLALLEGDSDVGDATV